MVVLVLVGIDRVVLVSFVDGEVSFDFFVRSFMIGCNVLAVCFLNFVVV